MAGTVKILKPNLLVVEGEDDAGFFTAFLRHLNLSNIQSKSKGSGVFGIQGKIRKTFGRGGTSRILAHGQ